MFSIIIPVYNESQSLKKLVKEIFESLKHYKEYEIVFVDDASNDSTSQVIEELKNNHNIRLFLNNKNKGQSFSIAKGIRESVNDIIITIDGDGQNNPIDIPILLDYYLSNINISLVGGIRRKRKDTFIKVISSKIANKVRSIILDDNCNDTGCSLKVFSKSIFLGFPYFDGIHRFLPALFKGYGHECFYIDVDHRAREEGVSKYGTIDRLFKGIIDIIKVRKILKKYKRSL